MQAVYKFTIDSIREAVYVDIPKGGTILSAGIQGGNHVLWALVNPDTARDYERVIIIAYTGDLLPPEHTWTYINTYTDNGLVYHAFEAL